ncbi:hypothetical protein DFH09DRAFT_1362990 [Mycena vulgaris]|nr:hypothetical protein DFH09DRAFT_1362990 [Mycena vulgaris]
MRYSAHGVICEHVDGRMRRRGHSRASARGAPARDQRIERRARGPAIWTASDLGVASPERRRVSSSWEGELEKSFRRTRAHLARLWAYFLHHEDMWWTSPSAGADISRIWPIFFEDCISSDIVEGAGGSFLDVASLVIAHTNMIASIISVSRTVEDEHLHFVEFLHAGLVQSYEMITVLDALEFVAPLRRLATGSGAREAIDTQLIVLVARCAIAAVGNNENAVQNILRGVLSGTLTFYSVLGRVEKALLQVDSLNLTPGLRRSTSWNDWAAFRQFAEERLVVKSKFDEERPSIKSCDNIECIQVSARTDFRRCSRCRSVSYCSPICQKKDWTSGEHRSVCKQAQSKDPELPHLSARERAFLRYLVHQDYLRRKDAIIERSTEFFLEFGERQPCYTQFSYADDFLNIKVLPISALTARISKPDSVRGRHEIARLARSGGKMQLHVVVIADAGWGHFIFCLMRTTHAQLRDALPPLAKGWGVDQST